jgi:hypothetical protein
MFVFKTNPRILLFHYQKIIFMNFTFPIALLN